MQLERQIHSGKLKKMAFQMRKWIIVLKIVFQFLLKPSSSYFFVVEKVCKGEIEKNPHDFYANWFLSGIYVENKKPEQAIKILNPLYSSGKGGRKLKMLLARAYFKAEDYDNVISILKNEKFNNEESSTYYMGVSLIEKGQTGEGINYLEKYLSKHPKDYNVHWKLGYEYFKLKEYEKALNSYIEARRINPDKKLDEGIKHCHERLGTTIH